MIETKNPFGALRKAQRIKPVSKTSSVSLTSDLKEYFKLDFSVDVSTIKSQTNDFITITLNQYQGSCSILGFTVNESNWKQKSMLKCYSPSAASFIAVEYAKPLEQQRENIENTENDTQDPFTAKEMAEIEQSLKSSIDPNSCILIIKPYQPGLSNLESLMPVLKGCFSPQGILPSFNILPSPQESLSFSLSPTEKSDLHDLKGIVCVVGQVNSGKSSLCRYIANRMLSTFEKVAYLDCDLGQPEFTPAGMLSLTILDEPLLGLPFTHLKTPVHSIYIGSTSAKLDPDTYISSLYELVSIYRSSHSHLPLVINTSGWIKGVGFDLLKHFIAHLIPDTLVMMTHQEASKTFTSPQLVEDLKVVVIAIQAAREDQVSRVKLNAADQRSLSMCAYFIQSSLGWSSTPLSSRQPYRVPWSGVKIKFLNDQVPFSQALMAINGSIVGLIIDSTNYHQLNNSDGPCFVPTHTPLVQKCVGLGLIRTIDPLQKCFYILTPVPLESLRQVNMLLRGPIEVPMALLAAGHARCRVPYTTFTGAEGVGAVEIKSRHLGRKKNQ